LLLCQKAISDKCDARKALAAESPYAGQMTAEKGITKFFFQTTDICSGQFIIHRYYCHRTYS